MIKVEQTKRLRYCSVCGCGIGAGEYVLAYGWSKQWQNICDLCAGKLAKEVDQKNQEWINNN